MLFRSLFQPRNQPILLLLLLFNASVLVFYHFTSPIPLPSSSLSATSSCEVCVATPSDPLCLQYGLDNIRLSRAYEGSGHRVRRFVEKALRGEEVSVGIIGASVSLGHGLDGAPTWHAVFVEALRELFPKVVVYDGSAAAMDSECLPGWNGEGADAGVQARSSRFALGRWCRMIWISISWSWISTTTREGVFAAGARRRC